MLNFDKNEIKQSIEIEQVFELLEEWGGEPEYTGFGILSATICHNPPGEGSRKLYFYENSNLFQCYTGCEEPSFDIFQLVIKVAAIQQNREFDLNDAVRYIAYKLGISGIQIDEEENSTLLDWKIFDRYDRIQDLELKDYSVELKEYDDVILSRLNYNIRIGPWLKEGMT